MPRARRLINSVAPIRICDNGGWTDTWFAEHGRIFNIGVYPYAEVQLKVYDRRQVDYRIAIHAENYGERYIVQRRQGDDWDRHPLLEAAIDFMGVPQDIAIEATIFCEAPAGCSTGTSAAVTVALIGALDLLGPGRMTPYEVALAAQRVETELLRQQCGVQDQLCSAYGGINFIDMHRYPHAAVSPIQIPNATWWELERRLALVFLGKSHSSSAVHRKVIEELEGSGPENPKLEALRHTAEASRDALYAGDFASLGAAMRTNTAAQAELHPELVSPQARQIIDIARDFGAAGWKVNGAGGDGGSITLLCGDRTEEKRALLKAIAEADPLFQNIPIYLSRHGLRQWDSQPDGDDTTTEAPS